MLIEHSLEIDAPSEVVWQVVSDLASYRLWNPFVVGAESALVVGEPIHMRVSLFSFWALPQTETVTEHEPGARFCYGLTGIALGALASSRCHSLHSEAPERTRYVSRFELRGWLEPIVRLLLGRRIERGFTAMSQAVAIRAMALAAGACPDCD